MNIRTEKEFEFCRQESDMNSHQFWMRVAQEYQWKKTPQKSLVGSFAEKKWTWFEDGTLNITESCLDRHVKSAPDKVAIYFEPNDPAESTQTYTYQQLFQEVCRFANLLKTYKVQKGDVVCFYMPTGPELLIGVLACARLGAIHSVVFGGFSSTALKERILDSQAKVVVTCDVGFRGSKTIPLLEVVREAVKGIACVHTVLIYQKSQEPLQLMSSLEKNAQSEVQAMSPVCAAVEVAAEDPLFILYTSGSTGKPKGLLHTVGGYMMWVGETFKNVFQYQEGDVFWCTADMGWITGHSYVAYGPLLNGATQVIFEGIPQWPDASRFWQVIEKYKVTHFYTAPTAIRALEAEDISLVRQYNMSSLKVLGSVGEPINEEAWQWYFDEVGKKRCPIVDTWWQTETGGIMISALAGVTPSIPAVATRPFPGVFPVLMSADGKEISDMVAEGALCISKPWPGLARTIYNDHERYLQTYFSTYPGYYFTGDGAKRFDNGDFRIIGRIDDVVNVSGHRIGTAEVEDVVNQHPCIVESAVIGAAHAIKGQCIVAFVLCVSRKPEAQLLSEVNELITKRIGPIAKLEQLLVVEGLPKTRSGKIMRRVLRKAYEGDRASLGDISTLVNPEVVDEIFTKCQKI